MKTIIISIILASITTLIVQPFLQGAIDQIKEERRKKNEKKDS